MAKFLHANLSNIMQQALTEEDFRSPIERIQPMSSEDEIIAVAEQNLDDYNRILDFGVGVSQSIGATAVDLGKDGAKASVIEGIKAGKKGPIVMMAPLKTASEKGLARAREKVEKTYKGEWGRLRDVVRGTVAVDSFDDLPAAVSALREHAASKGWTISTRPDDRFSNPTSAGYRDLQIFIQSPDGLQAEVQINTKAMWLAKETQGHKMFEEYRSIEPKLEDGTATPEETKRYEQLEVHMKELYAKAHEASGGDKALNAKRKKRKRRAA